MGPSSSQYFHILCALALDDTLAVVAVYDDHTIEAR